jgi:hypothetical protein
MLKIDIYRVKLLDSTREEMEIDEKDIKYFESIVRRFYTRKGIFKKFYKTYHIQILKNENNYFEITESSFNLLKEQLKGKYQSSHSTETVYKNYSERKGTSWIYRMK